MGARLSDLWPPDFWESVRWHVVTKCHSSWGGSEKVQKAFWLDAEWVIDPEDRKSTSVLQEEVTEMWKYQDVGFIKSSFHRTQPGHVDIMQILEGLKTVWGQWGQWGQWGHGSRSSWWQIISFWDEVPVLRWFYSLTWRETKRSHERPSGSEWQGLSRCCPLIPRRRGQILVGLLREVCGSGFVPQLSVD